jgi:hypothetical protein
MGRYDEYILHPPVRKLSVPDDGRVVFNGFFFMPEQLRYDFKIGHQILTKDMLGDNPAHYHNHHEVLMWLGATPDKPLDFGAEIHFCFGEELEEHVFTKPTYVVLPPNLVHCPMEIVNVERPIIQIEMMFAPEDGSERTRVPFFPGDADFYKEHPLIVEINEN